MQKILMPVNKYFDNYHAYIKLILIVFAAAMLAKGAVVFHGYATDDYYYIQGERIEHLKYLFSEGRYINIAILSFLDSIGVNITDMYFSLGIVTVFLYSAFVVSVLRFVGMADLPFSALVGAIIIAHPYMAEIFTFRVALPIISMALIFSIIALEMVIKNPATWKSRLIALLATLAMLLTYQGFLNSFVIVIVFAFMVSKILQDKQNLLLAPSSIYRERAITLSIIGVIAGILSLLIIWVVRAVSDMAGLVQLPKRTGFIEFCMINERIQQIIAAFIRIYWSAEPIFSGWIKPLVSLMLVISIVIIFWHLLAGKGKEKLLLKMSFIFLGFLLLIPASVGVIIVIKNWWPVPRVLSHVAIIIGLIFLLADMQSANSKFLKTTIFVSRLVILLGFIFLSNQIFADQYRINQWDKMMANRIISRFEIDPNFSKVKYVHLNGNSWPYQNEISTMQGDMNTSGFYWPWSKLALLSEVSGYKFEIAAGDKAKIGENYCKTKKFWPHPESITIENDLAIVCLKYR